MMTRDMTDRELLLECREYVTAHHIHEVIITDGKMVSEPCPRCTLLDSIDAALREPQEQPKAAPQERNMEHVGLDEPARIGVPAGAAPIIEKAAGRDTGRSMDGIAASDPVPAAPKFANVSCSQCGQDFGPGDHGYSHCIDHAAPSAAWTTIPHRTMPIPQFTKPCSAPDRGRRREDEQVD